MKWLLALLSLVTTTSCQAQPAPGLRLSLAGPPEAALLASPGCTPPDLPDAPARAVRTADGTVQLFAADQIDRANIGPDLRHLRHDCTVRYRGGQEDDPAAFDDRSWIASLWTEDGRTIWAILHNEFHGHLRPALCPSRRYMDCWYNSLGLAVSDDSGHLYRRLGLVAALPYRFDELEPGHHGYFNPTNIVRGEGGLLMFVFATRAGLQEPGNCLLRTTEPARADRWLAWNGSSFTVRFVDPYRAGENKAEHVCAPVGRGSLRWPVTSLVRHRGTGLYLATMEDASPDGGVYYATSTDLLQWSQPVRLMSATGPRGWNCTPLEPLFYPSLLDPDSLDRNFDTVGNAPLLFATRFEASDCKMLRDRTLVRWQVTIDVHVH